MSVAFSPDGKTFLTASYDTKARLWDAHTGRPLAPPIVHPDLVSAAAFSPTAAPSSPGAWTRRDSGTPIPAGPSARPWSIKTHSGPCRSAPMVIPSSPRHGRSAVVDAATGRPVGRPLEHAGLLAFAAFSPDGCTTATGGGDRTIRLWDAATGRPMGAPGQRARCIVGRSARMAGRSSPGPEDKTAAAWEEPTPAGPSARPWLIRAMWSPWPSARMAAPSSPAWQGARGLGRRHVPAAEPAPGAPGLRPVHGVQPRRGAPPHRRRRRDRAALGCRRRPAHRSAARNTRSPWVPQRCTPTAGRYSPGAATPRPALGSRVGSCHRPTEQPSWVQAVTASPDGRSVPSPAAGTTRHGYGTPTPAGPSDRP